MSLAQRNWLKACVVTAAVGLAGGCNTTPDQTSTSPRGSTASSSKTNADAVAQSPVPARFAGAVSLYGELVRRDGRTPLAVAAENIRQITASREGADFDVAIDPNGEWLCFASTRHSATASLYLRHVDGSTVTQLTSGPGNDVMPSFSPDGRLVAFASDRSGTWNIYVQPVDGGKAVQITEDPSQELHPSFSPDGSQLVFSALSSRSGQWEMVVVDLENPNRRRFIGYGLFPTFSPDGKKIAFQRASQRGARSFSVWTVDYQDGEVTRPTEIAAAGNAAIITPTWSPDGKRLAFATVVNPAATESVERPSTASLWMIDLDGTNRVRLTQDMFANLQPAWASDGSIYFISNRSGYENIWALKPMPEFLVANQTLSQAAEDAPPAASEE